MRLLTITLDGLLGAATVLPVGPVNAVLGVIVGGGILWALAWASPYLFGREGMGGGDIKLLAMIGAFLGWKPALLTIMIGSLTGSAIIEPDRDDRVFAVAGNAVQELRLWVSR